MRTSFLGIFVVALVTVGAARPLHAEPAVAATPTEFVQQTHEELMALINKGASNEQLSTVLRAKVNFEAVVERSFGNPCSTEVRKCVNRWESMKPAQRTKLKDLLIRLISRNYERNLRKTVGYDIKYGKVVPVGSESRVKTTASRAANELDGGVTRREAPISIDYLVNGAAPKYQIVDIYTEGSSLTKNWFQQFNADFANAKSVDAAVDKIDKQLTNQLKK